MTCRVGLTAADCITDHWLPALKGRPEPSGGRAPCPVCGTARALSVQPLRGRAVWNSHCECDRTEVGQAIADRVICYTVPRRRKPVPDLAELEALVLDDSVTINALRLGALLALGMPVAEAAEKLKLPRATWYNAVRILGQSRRSRGVRILGQDAHTTSPKTRTKPQVRRSLTQLGGACLGMLR